MKSEVFITEAVEESILSEDVDKSNRIDEIDINRGGQPPLLLAILLHKLDAARALLENGANPNILYLGQSIVLLSIKTNPDLTYELLVRGAKVSDDEKQICIDFIMNGQNTLNKKNLAILKHLGYDITENFKSTDLKKNKWFLLLKNNLGRGSYSDSMNSILKAFIDHGANPSQVFICNNGSKWTPLMRVIKNYFKYSQLCINRSQPYKITGLKELLKYGANINQKCLLNLNNHWKESNPIWDQVSPLSYALQWDKQGDMVKFLLENGASAEEGVRLFLEKNGNLKQWLFSFEMTRGKYLFRWAIENHNVGVLNLLIRKENGVIWGQCSGQMSPLSLAVKMGNEEIINLLVSKGIG